MLSIAQIVNPIHLPDRPSAMGVYNTAPPPPGTQPVGPNPYNSRVDGFVTKLVYGGITGKNMSHLLFNDTPPAEISENAVSPKTALRQTGINMGVGAAIYGGLSLLKQGIGLASGRQDAAGAAANISADILRGGGAGLGASAAGGLTGFAMKAIGATGTFGTIMTFIGGAVGATIGSGLVEATGVRDTLLKSFGSKKMGEAPSPLG